MSGPPRASGASIGNAQQLNLYGQSGGVDNSKALLAAAEHQRVVAELEQMPDPETVAKNREQYVQAVEIQIEQNIASVEMKHSHAKQRVRLQGEIRKREYCMQTDMEVREQENDLEKQRLEKRLEIQTQAGEQRAE